MPSSRPKLRKQKATRNVFAPSKQSLNITVKSVFDCNKSSDQEIYKFNQSVDEESDQIVKCTVSKKNMKKWEIEQHLKDCESDQDKHDSSIDTKYFVLTASERRNRISYRWVQPEVGEKSEKSVSKKDSPKMTIKVSQSETKKNRKRTRDEMEETARPSLVSSSKMLVINAPPPSKKHKRRFSKSPMTEMFSFLDAL